MCDNKPGIGLTWRRWLPRAGVLLPLLWAMQAQAETTFREPASSWDKLWATVIEDITILGVLFAVVTAYLVIRYRRRSPNEEGNPPKLSAAQVVGWTVIPAFIFMADDFYIAAKGWNLWNIYRTPPADRLEVKLMSGMYSWDYTYPNGVETQNELRVPAGKPVLLRMTSRDTIHSHYIPDFRVKEDSMPGRVTYLWFYPGKVGEHVVTCAEYCGVMHSYMVSKIIVMEPAAFDAWYQGKATASAPAAGRNAANDHTAVSKVKG